jgi:hypothetical protein
MRISLKRNSLVMLFLAILITPAQAQWEKISENNDLINYIDKSTIKKDGNLRKIWRLTDLKKREITGEMSIRMMVEHDCKEDLFRYLFVSNHSDPMAGGRIINQVRKDEKEWSQVPPETLSATIHKIVCAK